MKTSTEYIKFSLIHTPCCGQLLCWVNPRLPNYCPECGKPIWIKIKHPDAILFTDNNARLIIHELDTYKTAIKN